MKAFSFRLDKALHWREAQLNVQKSRTAAVLQRLAAIQAAIQAGKTEAMQAAADLSREPTDITLASYGGFLQANRNQSQRLNEQMSSARRALAVEMEQLLQANRRAHLLEKLKSADGVRWRKEFEREIAAFADESFLAGLQPKVRKQWL